MPFLTCKKVTLREQHNNDRFDGWDANCSCGWHGKAVEQDGARGMALAHLVGRGVLENEVVFSVHAVENKRPRPMTKTQRLAAQAAEQASVNAVSVTFVDTPVGKLQAALSAVKNKIGF